MRSDEITYTNYHGVNLIPDNAAALIELEKVSDQRIPKGKIGFYKTGYELDSHTIIGLSVCNRGLSALPESIYNLQNIKRLFLRDNELKALPSGIGKLTSLENLDVFNNQIESLPESICELLELKRIDLSRNPLKNYQNV